jgi:hypothetical protein
LNIEIGGVAYLIKTSEEWAQETLALLRSEIAWEVNTDGDTVTSWYMLMGDGFPVNGGERADYRRLRVILNDFPIKPAGKSLNSLISYINQILSDIEALQDMLAAHLADTRAHGATETPAPDRIAMYNSDSGLRSGKVPSAPADVIRKTELDAEAAARQAADLTLQQTINDEAETRGAADAVLQDNIDAEAEARGAADNTLQQNINNEAETRAEADSAEAEARALADETEAETRGAADSTLQQNIDAEAETRGEADENLSNEISDLYELALNTAADMIRFVDDEFDSVIFAYQRKIDKAYGRDEYREADNAGCCWQAPFVTEDEYDFLYNFVMSTTGAQVLALDADLETQKKPNRKVDKEGGVEEIRILDGTPLYVGVSWKNIWPDS